MWVRASFEGNHFLQVSPLLLELREQCPFSEPEFPPLPVVRNPTPGRGCGLSGGWVPWRTGPLPSRLSDRRTGLGHERAVGSDSLAKWMLAVPHHQHHRPPPPGAGLCCEP